MAPQVCVRARARARACAVHACGAETVGGPFRAGGGEGRVWVRVRGEGSGCGYGGATCSSSVGSMPGGGVEAIHAIDAMEPTEPTDANEAIEPILAAGHAASVGWAHL